ncbi:hypothetical protein SAMN05216206_2749 [Pseudomonas guineae]|uniref:Uncharacterized protein n=2 Tax=Pseudomonas guineae TaxID=425504 RepID=A0A1I3K8H5_9PSED|nr:hypothetical protein SAMN05216206_2749 [Pseudomonas guineae]
MRHVLIRFAGEIDAVVRRKARQLGQATRPGHKKTLVFRGYIVSAIGGDDRVVVTAIELPSTLREQENFVFSLDYSYLLRTYNIRKGLLLRPQWEPLKPGVYKDKPRSKISSVYFSCVTRSGPDRMRQLYTPQEDMREADYLMARSAGIIDQDQRRLRYEVEVNAQYRVTMLDEDGSARPWPFAYTSWRGVLAPLNDSMLVKVDTQGRRLVADGYELYIESGYLSQLYGSRVRFIGAPTRTNDLTDTAKPYGDPPPTFFYDGQPVQAPQLFGKRPGDVNSQSYSQGVRNPWPLQSTLEAFGARPQACHPHVAPSCDAPTDNSPGYDAALLMFPCVNVPDAFDVMSVEANDEYEVPGQVTRRTGNLSSLSFVLGAGDMLNSTDGTAVMGYGTPLACVLAVNPKVALTETEAASRLGDREDRIPNLFSPPSPYSNGARYPHPLGEVESLGAIGQYLDAARLVEGEPMPDIGAHLFVSLYDLPAWIWPDKVKDAWTQFITASGADLEEEPKLLSDQRMSAVFGEVRSTQVGNQLELLFSVTSRATTTVSVVNRLREYDNWGQPKLDGNGQFIYYGPTDAPVHQTKTALAKVTATINASDGRITGITPVSHELLHRDVLGPTRSSLFAGGMDASTAKYPAMLWGGVMQGKRVYLARAVRYLRDEFCGSLEQRTRSFQTGTENGSSFFEDNGRYGPRPDQAAFEELWLMVNGARTVIAAPNNFVFAPTIDGDDYFFGSAYRPLLGVNTSNNESWLIGTSNGQVKRTAKDRMLEERYGLGAVFNTVAQISSTDIMVLMHEPTLEGSVERGVALLRININSGAQQVVFTGDLPNSPNGAPSGRFFSLNCYQREVLKDGEVVMPAHLFLREGSGGLFDHRTYLFASADGGASWVMVRDDLGGGGGLGQYIDTAEMKSGAVDPASPLYKGRTDEQ